MSAKSSHDIFVDVFRKYFKIKTIRNRYRFRNISTSIEIAKESPNQYSLKSFNLSIPWEEFPTNFPEFDQLETFKIIQEISN